MKKLFNIFPGIQTKQLRKLCSALLLKLHPGIIFSILTLITLFLAIQLPSLKFNYDIEGFFSTEDPDVEFYYSHREDFENENDFVLIGIRNKEGIFQKEFLQKVDTLSKALDRYPHIIRIYSPTKLYETIKSPMGIIRIPLIHVNEPDKYLSDKNRIYKSAIYTNSFFSPDTLSVSLLIKKTEGLSRVNNDSLLFAINNITSSFGFDEFHIAGRIQTQHYYISHLKKQMSQFAGLALILFVGSLFLIFRNIRYVLMTLGVVLISLIWIFGIISWMGISIDLMLTLLPTLIFIISTSGSIHLITRFKNEYVVDVSKHEAIKKTITETGLPNFLNAFTTAIGFASLIVIPVVPIQRFGLITASGILLSFFIGLLLIPTILRILRLSPSKNSSDTVTIKRGSRISNLVLKKPELIISIFSLLILSGIFFSFQVKINNHFLDDLNPAGSLKQDLDFFEKNFSGIRPFEMNVQAKPGYNLLDYKALQELEVVEQYLKNEYNAGFLFSPLTFVKSINKTIHGGNHNYFKLPDSQQELDKILKIADRQRIWHRYVPVMSKNKLVARITGRTADEGSHTFKLRDKKLQSFLNKQTSYLDFRLTGAAHLMDNTNSHIAWHLTKGILLAIVVATLIIGLFTQSWKIAAISLIPNLIPLLLISGFMGASGIPLKVATALIFTIAYGIAVDDTIHFLNNYRFNRKIFTDPKEAIHQTLSKMWKPILFTSVVLLSGFMIFTLSEFPSISLLGFLISGALFIALLADLLLLPVLLTKSFHIQLIKKPK